MTGDVVGIRAAAESEWARRPKENNLPPSFVLPHEAVDRLRAAAGTIIRSSPEFQRLLKDAGAKMVTEPAVNGVPAAAH